MNLRFNSKGFVLKFHKFILLTLAVILTPFGARSVFAGAVKFHHLPAHRLHSLHLKRGVDGNIQIPLNEFVQSGSDWYYPSIEDGIISISVTGSAPVFSSNSIISTLQIANNVPSDFVVNTADGYGLNVAFSVAANASGASDGVDILTNLDFNAAVLYPSGASATLDIPPNSVGGTGFAAALAGKATAGSVTVSSISLTPPPPPVVSLPQSLTTNATSYLAVATVIVPGFDAVEGYQWTLNAPDGSVATVPAFTKVSNVTVNFDKPGKYVLSVQTTDGISDSNIATQTITYAESAPFQILLGGSQYLFKNCAPNSSDPCLKNQDQYSGGEFLVGDKVKLHALSNVDSYTWTITPENGGDQITLQNQDASFPITAAGGYSICLNGTSTDGGIVTCPVPISILAEKQISVTFPTNPTFVQTPTYSNKAQNFQYPGIANPEGGKCKVASLHPTRVTGACDGTAWGTNADSLPAAMTLFSSAGCVVTNLAEDLSRDFSGGNFFGLPSIQAADQLLYSKNVYIGHNDPNWSRAAAARNAYAPAGAAPWIYQTTENSRTSLDAALLARTRSYASLLVYGLGDTKGTQYPSYKHMLNLAGVSLDSSGKPIYSFADPANESRTAFNVRPYSQPPYNGTFRDVRNFALGQPTRSPGGATLYASTSSPAITFSSITVAGKEIKISQNQRAFQTLSLGSTSGVITNESVGDPDDSLGSTGSGGLQLTIPEADVNNISSIGVTATDVVSGSVQIQVLNSQDQMNAVSTIPVSLSSGQAQMIPVSVSNASLATGTMIVSAFSDRVDPSTGYGIAKIQGRLQVGAGNTGLNFSSSNLILSFPSTTYSIPAASMQVEAGTAIFQNPTSLGGIEKFSYQTSGDFELEIVGLNLAKIIGAASVPVTMQIGTNQFSGSIGLNMIAPPDLLSVELSKGIYAVGDLAIGTVTANTGDLQDSDSEFYLSLSLDGAEVVANQKSNPVWTFHSQPLVAGTHALSISLFLQSRRLAEAVIATERANRQKIFEIEREIARQTDPNEIQILETQKQNLLNEIAAVKSNLINSRTKLGSSLNESLLAQ